jgi:hypothetical protein
MPLNPLVPGPLAAGGERLVAALLGGDDAQEAGRRSRQMQIYGEQSAVAGLDRKMTEALLERDKRAAQQAYQSNLEAVGNAPDSARLLSSLMVGGNGAQIDDVQKYKLRGDALTSMLANPAQYTPENANLIALQGKPVENIDVDGDHVVMGKYGTEPVLDLTRLGETKVASTAAQKEQRLASADASEARAARSRAAGVSGSRSGGSDDAGPRSPMVTPTDVPGAHVQALWDNFANPKVRADFIAKYGQVRYAVAARARQQYLSRAGKQALPPPKKSK